MGNKGRITTVLFSFIENIIIKKQTLFTDAFFFIFKTFVTTA